MSHDRRLWCWSGNHRTPAFCRCCGREFRRRTSAHALAHEKRGEAVIVGRRDNPTTGGSYEFVLPRGRRAINPGNAVKKGRVR